MDHVGCNFQILVHLINDFHGSMVIAVIYNCEILILKIFVKIDEYIIRRNLISFRRKTVIYNYLSG